MVGALKLETLQSNPRVTPRGRLLVVDDDPRVLKSMTRMLTRMGFSVDTAPDGRAASRQLSRSDYHCVISDISMPEMGGIGLLTALREHDQDVPVILIPGYALNRGTFLVLALYLRRRGWRWVWGLNNRPHSCPADRFVSRLSERVDRVLAQTGASQVDLVGHSMGGALAAAYVVDHDASHKVRRIVSLGTPWQGTAAHVWAFRRQARDLAPDSEFLARARTVDIPLVAIWSESDIIVIPPRNARPPQGRSVHLPHIGHMELLFNVRSMRAVASALRGELDGPSTEPAPA